MHGYHPNYNVSQGGGRHGGLPSPAETARGFFVASARSPTGEAEKDNAIVAWEPSMAVGASQRSFTTRAVQCPWISATSFWESFSSSITWKHWYLRGLCWHPQILFFEPKVSPCETVDGKGAKVGKWVCSHETKKGYTWAHREEEQFAPPSPFLPRLQAVIISRWKP